MADTNEVKDKLLDQILASAEKTTQATNLLRLAEAYAWIVNPNQSHGGSDAG